MCVFLRDSVFRMIHLVSIWKKALRIAKTCFWVNSYLNQHLKYSWQSRLDCWGQAGGKKYKWIMYSNCSHLASQKGVFSEESLPGLYTGIFTLLFWVPFLSFLVFRMWNVCSFGFISDDCHEFSTFEPLKLAVLFCLALNPKRCLNILIFCTQSAINRDSDT